MNGFTSGDSRIKYLVLLCGLVFALALSAAAPSSHAAVGDDSFSEVVYSNGGRLVISNSDGSDRRLLTRQGLFPYSGGDVAPEFSPDGSQIAFMGGGSFYDEGGANLMVMDRDGSNLRSLSQIGADPSWAPDGKSIFYLENNEGKQTIKNLSLDGSGTTTVFEHKGPKLRITDLDPSPSGDQLIVGMEGWTKSHGREFARMFLVDTRTGASSLLAKHASRGDWSPDGSRIVFDSKRKRIDEYCWKGRCSSVSHLYVMDADGTGVRRLIPGGGTWNETNSRWSPDGTRISLTSNRNGSNEIYTVKLDGSCLAFLTNGSPDSFQGSWNPTGTGPAGRQGCGNAGAIPVIEYPTRNYGTIFGHPNMWLGESYLSNATSQGHDLEAGEKPWPAVDNDVYYSDCLEFNPNECDYGVSLQTERVCRVLPTVFELWDPVVYKGMVKRRGALVVFWGWEGEKGVAAAEVLSGGRSIWLSSGGPSDWHNEFPRARFLRMVDQLRPTWQVSLSADDLPAAQLAPWTLKMYRKVLRLRQNNSFKVTAKKAGMSKRTLKYQLATARDIERLGPVGQAKGCGVGSD